MYCRNCGKEIEYNAIKCLYCAAPAEPVKIVQKDSDSLWWSVLGCCFPTVGLVLYIVWKDTKPQSGKKAGIGALIGFALRFVPVAVFCIFLMIFASMTM